MKLLTNADVEALLPMTEAIEVAARTMQGVSRGEATMPLRSVVPVGGKNMLGVMPGAVADTGAFGVKLVCLFPDNPQAGFSSHQGAMIVFEPEHGHAVAMMNADRLTAIRTAAASAVATRALARPEARVLTLIGTGEQAETHLAAICAVRDIAEVRVVGSRPGRATPFVARMTASYPQLTLTAVDDTRDACAGADIICTVTSSATPVLMADWVGPGTHVNAVGASIPSKQEIDTELAFIAKVFTDYRPSALAQAAEIITLIKSGRVSKEHIRAEIGEVLNGAASSRENSDEITMYRSLGVIAQDLACAQHVVAQAEVRNRGTQFDFG